ncbi:MAG: hypothetical protein KDK66_08085, partial [Deltaproteobacteria bacterium]|nr:hypothetical protein [Deltaproteobacteria bacterium]
MESLFKQLLQNKLKTPLKLKKYQKLFGQASYREYYRLTLENGQTYIVMKLPGGLESPSEEVTNEGLEIKELPFLNVARYLDSQNLP